MARNVPNAKYMEETLVHMMTRIAAQVTGVIIKRSVIPAPLVLNVRKLLTVKGGAAII